MENDNSLSVIYAIHMKTNLQMSKQGLLFRLHFNVYTDVDR